MSVAAPRTDHMVEARAWRVDHVDDNEVVTTDSTGYPHPVHSFLVPSSYQSLLRALESSQETNHG